MLFIQVFPFEAAAYDALALLAAVRRVLDGAFANADP